MGRPHHALLLPGGDTASIMREPDSALSDTLQEPQTHASPLHCPAQVSSIPVRTKKKNKSNAKIHFGIFR